MADTHKGWLKANMDEAWEYTEEHASLDGVLELNVLLGKQAPDGFSLDLPDPSPLARADLRTMDDDDPRTH